MKYRVASLPAFEVLGQEIEITTKQRQNICICKDFWKTFNKRIKTEQFLLKQHWIKYAFTYKREDRYYYYCAILKGENISNICKYKQIPAQRYLVFEHRGSMETIYQTYNSIYGIILPKLEYTVNKKDFFHFEKYDARFHWNRKDSIIEIWIPLEH